MDSGVDDTDPGQQEISHKYVERVFQHTIALGGTMTGEHGLGIAKSIFVPLQYSEAEIGLMRRVKRAFDPKGLLNPVIFPRTTEGLERVRRRGGFIL